MLHQIPRWVDIIKMSEILKVKFHIFQYSYFSKFVMTLLKCTNVQTFCLIMKYNTSPRVSVTLALNFISIAGIFICVAIDVYIRVGINLIPSNIIQTIITFSGENHQETNSSINRNERFRYSIPGNMKWYEKRAQTKHSFVEVILIEKWLSNVIFVRVVFFFMCISPRNWNTNRHLCRFSWISMGLLNSLSFHLNSNRTYIFLIRDELSFDSILCIFSTNRNEDKILPTCME